VPVETEGSPVIEANRFEESIAKQESPVIGREGGWVE
jgi:hypothetical protein